MTMKFHFLSAIAVRVGGFGDIAKPIGLLILLLNTQLSIGQEAAAAKNAFRPYPANLILAQQFSPPDTEPAAICLAQLGNAIETVTNRPEFSRGRWGILIQTLSRGDTVYNRDAQKYFVPASNLKLLTTAAVLQQLGAEFRIRTSVYRTSNRGLRIVGRGDPSLTDAQLKELAQQLSQQGIRQVSQAIAEDDYFRGPSVAPSWEWEDVQVDYGAPVNSLILNQNAVKLTLFPQQIGQPLRVNWTDPTEAKQWQIKNEAIAVPSAASVGVNVTRESQKLVLKITGQLGIDAKPESISLAVVDPNEYFLRHFRRALVAEGIDETAATGRVVQIARLENLKLSSLFQQLEKEKFSLLFNELAFIESPPLSELLKETNQNSNNLYAEALLRVLGARVGKLTTFTDSTAQMGLQVVKGTLATLGVDPSSYTMADASGLSRHNLVSPEAIAQTLRAMARSPLAAVYRASLPVAGISGTLQGRLRDTTAQGIVQAKTGTLSGAVALSGYVDAPHYEPLVFSIIVNQSDRPAANLRQAIDDIVLLLTRLHRC